MKKSSSRQLFDYITGYQISQAIFAANELGVAEHLVDGPIAIRQLAQVLSVDSKVLARLLRLLASVGIFEETAKDVFGLTDLSQCLRKDHPESLYYAIHNHTHISYSAWSNLIDSLKTGNNAFESYYHQPYFDYLKAHDVHNRVFNNYMKQRSQFYVQGIVAAYDFKEAQILMDVGGGYGHILLEILNNNPDIKGILFDQEHVLADARTSNPKLESTCQLVAGSFFDPLPSTDADSIFMKHILHDWPDEDCINILTHCYNALPENGHVIIAETVIENCSNNEATEAKSLDMHMHVLFSAQERTIDEFKALFAQTGFKLKRIVKTETMMSVLVAQK